MEATLLYVRGTFNRAALAYLLSDSPGGTSVADLEQCCTCLPYSGKNSVFLFDLHPYEFYQRIANTGLLSDSKHHPSQK